MHHTGTITTQKTQKVGPATKHKSGVQIEARKGERYKLLRDNTTFISALYIQGRFARYPAPRRVRCRAGLVTPRFRYLVIESWFSGTLSVARGRPSWFPREICVAGGAPPESWLASSLAGLYRVGPSTRWCGWVKVKR
jgi:hypothetical protein